MVDRERGKLGLGPLPTEVNGQGEKRRKKQTEAKKKWKKQETNHAGPDGKAASDNKRSGSLLSQRLAMFEGGGKGNTVEDSIAAKKTNNHGAKQRVPAGLEAMLGGHSAVLARQLGGKLTRDKQPEEPTVTTPSKGLVHASLGRARPKSSRRSSRKGGFVPLKSKPVAATEGKDEQEALKPEAEEEEEEVLRFPDDQHPDPYFIRGSAQRVWFSLVFVGPQRTPCHPCCAGEIHLAGGRFAEALADFR